MTLTSQPRIGVLTYHNGPNFGGYMQAWHLVHALRDMGFNAHAVNYLHPAHHSSNQIHIPIRKLSSLKAKAFWALKKRGFRNIEAAICRHAFTTDPAQVPWKDFDAFVVGSDIVFDYQDSAYGHDPVYFGQVPGLADRPIVSYAASCGPADPAGPFPDYVGRGLKRFVSIGVRDDATAKLVKNSSSRDSKLVVDPTWLGSDPEVRWNGLPKAKYLFAYGGSFKGQLGHDLKEYCASRGLLLVSALTSCPQADKIYRTLTPFQWVQLFKHAEATAINGTLHGTLFTVKYGKPFILLNTPAISPKTAEVLQRTSQHFRLFEQGTVKKEDLKMLDSDQAEPPSIPIEWVEESRQFLGESLAKALA